MYISKLRIKNFKGFKELFTVEFTNGLNIIVGNNEAGKSTILEAIHLVLTGMYNGKYLKNELSEYLFNNSTLEEYKKDIADGKTPPPPEILIEIIISGEDLPFFEGDNNADKKKECGVVLKICLDEKHRRSYEEYVKEGATGIPIEYYDFTWETCAREVITPRKIPIKSALIDSSSNRYQNGSDVYINHIIRNHLDEDQKISLAQAHRKLQGEFINEQSVKAVNDVIKKISKETEQDKEVRLSVDLSSKNAWENSFVTYVEDVPFHHIGKGEQAIVKTKLALQHKKTQEASLILLEEPENHLSHSKLNQLIKDIESKCVNKQIIISTHSSFVANKLGLENLLILNDKKTTRLDFQETSTQEFFKKIAGYDTLRLILCKKAILVEGDSDELIIQRAFMKKNAGKLPIEMQIDVISVRTSFLRFLEIAAQVNKPVTVVTDNDGKVEALKEKYKDYLGDNKKANIKICFDGEVDQPGGTIDGALFNFNTLEPKLIKANSEEKIGKIIGSDKRGNELHKYMQANKTECALKIFSSSDDIEYPQYILDAINE